MHRCACYCTATVYHDWAVVHYLEIHMVKEVKTTN